MDKQLLESANGNFSPKFVKFYDELDQEIQWEQVTKLNLARQADFIAEKFFELKEVAQQQSEEIKRLQKWRKRLVWLLVISNIIFWLLSFYNAGVLF